MDKEDKSQITNGDSRFGQALYRTENISVLSEKFVIRFPQGMRTRIHAVANKNRRSMNKEIIARLEHSLNYFSDVVIPVVPVASRVCEESRCEESQPDFIQADARMDENLAAALLLNHKLQQRFTALSVQEKQTLLSLLSELP